MITAALWSSMMTPRSAGRPAELTGVEGMVGERGIASTDIEVTGKVKVRGEIWSATSSEPVKAGDTVIVMGMEGMVLQVSPVKDEQS